MNENFAFLKSTRFWALVLGSASTALVNSAGEDWRVTLGKFLGLLSAGFIAIRTVDRTADKVSLEVEKPKIK